MNVKIKIGLILFCLALVNCISNDDDLFRRSVSLNIQDAFLLENQKQYSISDTIFFELRFSRYLPEEGFSELLDIYETTKSEDFTFSFGFEKFSELEGGFRVINIDQEFIVSEQKNLDDFSYYNGFGMLATLNAARDTYEAKVGIILAEEGTFQFNFNNVFIESPFKDDGVYVRINHSFSAEDLLDVEFMVTE